MLAAFSLPALAQAPSWIQNSPPPSLPSQRYNSAMAYDATHSQVVLFGGEDSGSNALNDTWLYDGLSWRQIGFFTPPGARFWHVMAPDALGHVVLFGGCGASTSFGGCDGDNILGDTWIWDGSSWTAGPSVANGPGVRLSAAMAYDPVHGKTVLFGGFGNGGPLLGDTWLWDGTAWTQATPNAMSLPPARGNSAMALDPLGHIVLFGGTDSSGHLLGDTWWWDGSNWNAGTNSGPNPRVYHAMAYDAAQGRTVLFGGADNTTIYSDTWVWDGSAWTSETISPSPNPREAAALAYDAAVAQVVLFGGTGYSSGDVYYNDTWSYAVPTTLTVTSSADDGSSGTLRTLLAAAAPGDTINFAPSLNGQTITLDCTDSGFGTIVLAQNVTIVGPGANNLAISGNSACTVFQVNQGVTATISGVTIENGYAVNGYGGGILNDGTLTVSNSAFAGNSTSMDGSGGGIYNQNTLTVSNSTFSSNRASFEGGGIYNQNALTVSNSTFSGNYAYQGGGLYNLTTLTVSNSTFSGNSASVEGGAGIAGTSSTTLKGVLLAGQASGGNCFLYGGTPTSDGYNLSDDSSCTFLTATGDLSGVSANLGTLGNNGGPTQTIPLLSGSPAIDAIPSNSCTDAFGNLVTADQRGIPRPQGKGCDIGAFELQSGYTPNLVANVCPNGQTTPAPCSVTFSLQFTVPSGTTLGSTPVQVVTQGATGLDFNPISGGGTTTCTSGFQGPATCTVQATFAPIAPGVRQGAISLTDNNGSLVVRTLLTGLGQAPQLVFPGGPEVTVNNGFYPEGVATDAAGNVYMSGYPGGGLTGYVIVIPAGCSSGSCYKQWGSGWIGPGQPAVDGAGNIYVPSEPKPSATYIVPQGCTSSSCETTVGSGIAAPNAVALDGAGDIYIADEYNGHPLYEVPVVGSQTTVGSGVIDPEGLALDDLGDVLRYQPSPGSDPGGERCGHANHISVVAGGRDWVGGGCRRRRLHRS